MILGWNDVTFWFVASRIKSRHTSSSLMGRETSRPVRIKGFKGTNQVEGKKGKKKRGEEGERGEGGHFQHLFNHFQRTVHRHSRSTTIP